MPDTLSQDKRLIAVETPLGKDVLVLTAFSGEEEMSRLFSYGLEMLSSNHDIKPADLVGKSVSFRCNMEDGTPRWFNGHVARFSGGVVTQRGLRRYTAEVVPWLWFLTRTADCRIFQEMSALEIIEKVFADCGLAAFEKKGAKRALAKRTYCVQYRETDFHFVSRLLEEEGIFYFFRHEKGKHTLVLADSDASYEDAAEKEISYRASDSGHAQVRTWDHRWEFRPGKWAQTDYNFETPTAAMLAQTSTVVKLPDETKYEVFDYPGLHLKKADGDGLVKVRMEEEETPHEVIHAAGDYASLSPGTKFTVKAHEIKAEEGKKWVVASVRHSGSDDTGIAGGGGAARYGNDFSAIPSDRVFRPERLTPRPVVRGIQTATVVGPSGEEIYTDKYGRVKAQFHWDREGKKDDKSSCWIRVAQGWAGNQWGIHFHPRIGQEVVVSFLEGDPDRPLITGSVYNADQMPPYALPANQTQSGVKTRSSKGGGAEDFNELRFEDKKGSEEVYFHAQKDFKRVVENDDVLEVGHDQTITVKNARTETVEEADETVTIKKGKRTITVDTGDDMHQVKKGNRTVKVDTGNDLHQVAKGNRDVKVDTGNDTHAIAKGNRAVSIDMGNDTLTIKMGNRTTAIKMGKDSVEAMQAIELKVGASLVKIDQTGVTIKGMMVKIEATTQLQQKGLMTQINGDAMLQLKGGITMIN